MHTYIVRSQNFLQRSSSAANAAAAYEMGELDEGMRDATEVQSAHGTQKNAGSHLTTIRFGEPAPRAAACDMPPPMCGAYWGDSYCWVTLVACGIGLIATFPGHTFGWSLFLPSITEEIGTDMMRVSVLWSIALVVCSLVLPLVGRCLDQLGAWKSLCWAFVPFSVCVAAVSCVCSEYTLFLAM